MVIVRWLLALLTVVYALFNAVAPLATLLYKLQTEWPQGWAMLQRYLSFPAFSIGANRFAPLMGATNWLQVGMWLLADVLYISAALRLIGARPKGAVPVFGVALLLDAATWLTFKRMPIYNETFSQNDQQQTLTIFVVVAVIGGLIWLTTRRARRPRVEPTFLTE